MDRALLEPENYEVVGKLKGKDLLGTEYNPLYTFLPVNDKKYAYVLEGDFVSTEEGTGIVHIAPAYGVDDMAMVDEYDLPVIKAVEEDGRFVDAATPFRGYVV